MRCAVREPKRPSDFLGRILKDARTVATHSDTERALGSVLGADAAAHCTITGMSAGKLIVEVDSAPLYAELRGFRGEDVRRALNEQLNGRKVGQITFRPGRSRDV